MFGALFAGSAIALAGALASGSVAIPPGELWLALTGGGSEITRTVVLELRLPRALAAFATGGLLALAGALMQVLLRNPLADPYVLGISGGAAVAALLAIMAGLSGFWIDAGAFGGALAATLMVFAIARGPGGWTPARLLLTGIVMAAGFSAVISLLLALGTDSSLRGMLFWLMGDLSFANRPGRLLVMLAAAVVASFAFARPLNVLARGDVQARLLGVPVRMLRIAVYVAASLLTALAVTTAGTIGFVGLVVPHLLRLAAGADHRIVLPGAVLLGGSLLVLADTLARIALAPRQLPVGALTAMIGVPLFIILMNRQQTTDHR
ncbi:MAG: FecCD family ABC transporter permease [Gammaproteobacteria bacterium]